MNNHTVFEYLIIGCWSAEDNIGSTW